jgi:hypothetical protein
MNVESAQASAYLKRVYMKMIDGYLKGASFVKPTGDGLLAVFHYEDKTLSEVASSSVESCLALLSDYPDLCRGDETVNFEIPTRVGIGMTRGTATKLTSGGEILDYSGRPLNLASRLEDLARPSGLVLDESYGINLIPEDARKRFASADVYPRGIAEQKPLRIYYTEEFVTIPSSVKSPPNDNWKTSYVSKKVAEWKKVPGVFRAYLPSRPRDSESIQIEATYVTPEDLAAGILSIIPITVFQYDHFGGRPAVEYNIPSVLFRIPADKLDDNLVLTVYTKYRET